VTIASPPVVNFKLATDQGVPIIGFGSTAKCFKRGSSTISYVPTCYPNLQFSLAKLVPGSGGTPSKWVNYIVAVPPTTAAPALTARPGTDNYGTLVDNKDGTYRYTFYFDVPGMKDFVAILGNQGTADGYTSPNKADLGDLTYNANATHRLTIQIAGSAPGTGTNTSDGKQVTPGVSLQKPVDVIYDFVPATGAAPAAAATRKMVANANCESCHSTLGGLPGGDGSSLDFHGSSRNNIDYCLICHTEQRKFGQIETPLCGQQSPATASCYDPTTRTFKPATATTPATTTSPAQTAGQTATYLLDGRAIGNTMNFAHKTHVGGVMTKTGYNYAGVAFDKAGYSQDIRNCDKCHDSANPATPQASLWKTEANRTGCGSCHDGINFDTGVGLTLADKAAGLTVSIGFFGAAHPANSTDGTCLNSSCHNPGAGGDPDLVHKPVTPPSPINSLQVDTSAGGSSNTNAGWIASNQNRLPVGAIKVSYDVKSVSVVDVAGVRRPQMVFRMLQNGARKDLNATTAADNPVTGQKEMWDGFMGGPSLYFVWSVPQDGITQPVDFNASGSMYLRCLWNGTAPLPDPDTCISTSGTLSAPDTDGYYTATLTGIIIPADAVMVTGGVGYSYNVRSTLPLTQTNLPAYPATKTTLTTGITAGMPNAYGGLIVVAPNVQKVASAGCVDASPTPTGVCLDANNQAAASGKFVGRRAIVEDKRCNACHQELGTFTEEAFHGGQRNDGTTCSWCHTPNRNSSGWTAQTDNMTHAIHGADRRTVDYSWHAICPTGATKLDDCKGFWEIVYPGVLARCEQCHLPGTYDFTASTSANAVGLGADGKDKRQFRTVASGTVAANLLKSPYVVAGSYGAGFSFNATTGITTPADGTTLVTSPTVTACVGCHDSSLAISHMQVNGGSFYAARSTNPQATVEQCFICHATGRTAGIKEMHAR
jgi:OmcA/MtrC family decaheme c-type cytochrome